MFNNHICALDIGSSKISAAVALIKKRGIADIFFSTRASKAIKRGQVLDSLSLVNSISGILKDLKNKSGINIRSVCVNISGEDIVTKHSRSIMPLAERGNKVITLSDLEKVNEQARILGSNLEEEIIHALPFSYAIDSKDNIPNPLGLYSHRLEVDLYLICAKLSSVQSLARVINQAGYEIEDLCFSGLATSKAVFDKQLKQGCNIICDIGLDITELLVFGDGILKDIRILPFGGDDLTAEIADKLKITHELAENVKCSHGLVGDYNQIKEDKEILIKKNNTYKPIGMKLVSQILTAKAGAISQAIKEAVSKLYASDNVNNFIVTGRTVLLEGFIESLENNLEIPVKLGRLADPRIINLINKENSPGSGGYLVYLTCMGIIYQALNPDRPSILADFQPTKNILLKALHKTREIYQEYF